MKRKSKYVFILSFVFLAMGISPLLPEQKQSSWAQAKFEFSTALSVNTSLVDSSYFHRYAPTFQSAAHVSDAQQTISIDGGQSLGFSASFGYFFSKNFGFEVLTEYLRPPLSGENSSYVVHLEYDLIQHSGPPYPYVYDRTYTWPSTEGQITQVCLDLNLVMRLELGRMLTLHLSGGPTYFRIEGKATSLGYTKFWLDKENLWIETNQIKYQFGPANKIGGNLGAELSWLLFGNVAFLADLRYYYCPVAKVHLDIADAGLSSDSFDQIKAVMALGNIRINPSFYRLSFGLKYIF